jgi:hypothetical protein
MIPYTECSRMTTLCSSHAARSATEAGETNGPGHP